MDILAKLFGTESRVRALRLFLFNPLSLFDAVSIAAKAGYTTRAAQKELDLFVKMGLIKKVKKGKSKMYALDAKFKFVEALSDFLVRTHSLERKNIIRKIEKTGRIKAVLMAGVFLRDPESRLDLFVIGDGVNTSSLSRVVKGIESDMGKDIRYSVLSGPDFAYRMSMNDRLVRDILDFPHEVLVDKIGIAKA